MSSPIYMDYNATTPIAPSVIDAMMPFLTTHYGNPSSDHALGRACFHAIEDARENVARLLNAESDEIFFTSGGSESNNLAILGVANEATNSGKRHFITMFTQRSDRASRAENPAYSAGSCPEMEKTE